MSKEKLTDKQKLFADYYVGEAGLNATRAARLAGYKGDENSLAAQGSRLLRNVKVREYIDEQLESLTLSQNEVLTILTRHAKASMGDILDDEGGFDFEDVKRRGADALIKKLKITKKPLGEITHEFEMYDSQAAAVHLGKVYKLFTDRQEIGNKDGEAFRTQNTDLSNLSVDELLALKQIKSKVNG